MRKRITQRLIGLDRPTTAGDRLPSANTGDFDLNPSLKTARRLTPAAVLVPLIDRPDGLTVLLTLRTDHLHDHAGQISFPGGRVEEVDNGPVATALRETEEEIDLKPDAIEIAGYLDTYETATGYLVTPVVGFVRPGFSLRPDEFEVADVFEVPLSFIFDPANHQTGTLAVGGLQRLFHVFEYENRFIWGATAGILMNLFRRVSGEISRG